MIADVTDLTSQLVAALKNLDSLQSKQIMKTIENEHTDPYPVIEQILIQSLEQIGLEWEEGTAALSQVYMSGIIVESLITQHFKEARSHHPQDKKIGIVTLADQHTLGKKLVSMMLFAQGYQISDLGQGLTPEQIALAVSEQGIDILLVSSLMLPAALQVKKIKILTWGFYKNYCGWSSLPFESTLVERGWR